MQNICGKQNRDYVACLKIQQISLLPKYVNSRGVFLGAYKGRYWEEGALNRNVWRIRRGESYEPVVRQTKCCLF
jgi:hypothetical protein